VDDFRDFSKFFPTGDATLADLLINTRLSTCNPWIRIGGFLYPSNATAKPSGLSLAAEEGTPRFIMWKSCISIGAVGAIAGITYAGWSPLASASGGDVTVQLPAPIVGMAPTPTGGGYWEAAADGSVYSFGDAEFYGSEHSRLHAPVVGMAAAPTGHGYWMAAADGGVFAFGSARFFGSMGGRHLNAPIVGMAAAPTGNGYWEVSSDGGVFAFGNAAYQGSVAGSRLHAPIVGIAADTTGAGYWEAGRDGGVFAFGDAGFDGSMAGQPTGAPVVGVAADSGGAGYWEVAERGEVFSMGDAPFEGAIVAATPGATIVRVADGQVGNTDPHRYGPDGSTWCGYFASWVWRSAGVPIPATGPAADVGTWALTHGGTILPPTATPAPGDAVLWVRAGTPHVWPDRGALSYPNIEHVNIVTGVFPNRDIVTVGGNEDGAVRRTGPFAPAGASSSFGQAVYGFVQPPG
jgi:CHAP domain